MKRVQERNINTPDYWDRRYANEAEEMWRIWTTHDLVEKVAAHIPTAARVLDVGCGAGIIPVRISKIRGDLTWSACDFSAEACSYLRALGCIRFERVFQGDVVYGLPCPDKSYDVVICTEVLEHLSEPVRAVAEMARIAKGRTVITTPNQNAIDGPEHVWSFSREDLAALLEPHGAVRIETARHGRNLVAVCLIR